MKTIIHFDATKLLFADRDEARVCRLELTLHRHELDHIKQRARECGHRPGAWARHVLMMQMQPASMSVPPDFLVAWQRLAEVSDDLRGVAGNLNQLAKYTNQRTLFGQVMTESEVVVQTRSVDSAVELVHRLRTEVAAIRRILNPIDR